VQKNNAVSDVSLENAAFAAGEFHKLI